MKAFSIESALGAGFRLIKREPLAVLMWGLAYAAATVVIQAIAMGPAIWTMIGAGLDGLLSSPEQAAEAYEAAAAANALLTVPLVLLLSIGAYAVLYGAIARAELHPEDRRFFFLRLSKREFWIAVSYLALSVLFIVGVIVVCIPIALVVRAAATGSDSSMLGWGLLLGIPAFVGLLYVSARFSMTWIMAFEEERFILFESWRLTKGHGWRLLLLMLALMFLLIIVSIGLVLAVVVVGGILALVFKAMGVLGAILGVLAILALIVAYVAMFGAMYAFLLGPFLEAYRGIHAAQTAGPDLAAP